MRPEDRDLETVLQIRTSALQIQEYVAGRTYQDYLDSRMLRGAVEREVLIIGEAAGRVSERFTQRHPEIPWRGMIGQRNVLAHAYELIRDEAIWRVATEEIPELLSLLEPLLPPEDVA